MPAELGDASLKRTKGRSGSQRAKWGRELVRLGFHPVVIG